MKFVDRKKGDRDTLSYTCHRRGASVSIGFDITWEAKEEDVFTFNTSKDAESWKELVPLSEILESESENLSLLSEVEPEDFKKLLEIKDEEWVAAWSSPRYTRAKRLKASEK